MKKLIEKVKIVKGGKLKNLSMEMIEKNDREFFEKMVKDGIEISIKSYGIESGLKDYVRWEIDFMKDNKIIRRGVVGGMYDIRKGLLDAIYSVTEDRWADRKELR